MFRGVRLAVVVPALDEEASIAEVVESFRRIAAVDEVVVVDNGSRDRTGERARSAGARVLNEPRPGYGSALRAGIGHVIERGAGLVALAEADGTFEAADLEQLLAGLGPEGLVLGSRHAQALRRDAHRQPGRRALPHGVLAGLGRLADRRRLHAAPFHGRNLGAARAGDER
jgi:glycosyltransferase involved in cell wall biosynthesis